MQEEKSITIFFNKKEFVLNVGEILYVIMKRNYSEIHVSGGKVYNARMTLMELEGKLGDDFILVHRSILVSAMAIHDVRDKIYLSNGETLKYVVRKKKEIVSRLKEIQREMINSFVQEDIPKTEEEYHDYYRGFDNLPFAFTDIEMVFNEDSHAVDWIFRYGNAALAKLEKMPLEQLIGSSFGSLFSNMDSKWLRSYERATLYGEKREIIDYSPEIEFTRDSSDAEKALMLYFGKLPNKNS